MAKYMKTEDGYQKIEVINANKMNMNNPVGTGSFSMGRKAGTTVGSNSHAEGGGTTASGPNSHAEGSRTTASGYASHAEGRGTTASGYASHAEGRGTTASGSNSHAEGGGTTASGYASHAEGGGTTASGYASHAEGGDTVASTLNQHVSGSCNILDPSLEGPEFRGRYIHIVGNGLNKNSRSNAHTLDWNGNAWFAGDVYVGSTSGTNKDDGSKKLATEDYVNNNVDATLTKSGQAADAAKVGEELSSLSGKIANQGTGSGKTALDAFIDNTDIDHLFDGTTGAYYTVIRVYKQKLDGSYQYPFVYAPNGAGAGDKSTYDMTVEDGWLLAINSGIFNTSTKKPDGIVIQNGVVVQNLPSATHSQCKPLTIDSNGDLSYADYDADAEELVASGIVSAVCGFMPIVVDYVAVDSSKWNSVSHYTENAQRQIIGQWGNGDYAIVTCEGRSYHNSDGWTIAEAQDICIKHGLKFAYNLDGGGSIETMLGKKHINTIYENTTGRIVPTFIVFNGTTVPPTTSDSGGGEETKKTLDSIAATYSGGDVAVGTDVTALTGIVVTATYSDGSTEAVTGYTLSGAIAEGSNTITVSYGGKTTTFTVNGVADSGFEPVTANATFLVHYTNVVNNNGISGNTAYSWHLNNINSRIAAVTVESNIDGQQTETVNDINYYPIPVPSGATKVIITCPGFIPGDRYYSYDADAQVYTSLFDHGWQSEGGVTRELAAEYEYMTVNFKEVVESGYIPDGTDTSGFSIVFE